MNISHRSTKRICSLLAAAAIACNPGPLGVLAEVHAQDAPSEAKKADAEPTFAPDVEKKLKELQQKLRGEVLKHHVDRMETVIASVAKITGLDEAGKVALKDPAKKASERSAEKTAALMESMMRKQYRRSPEQLGEVLEQMAAQPEQFAQPGSLPGETQPEDELVWTDALQKTLSAEQYGTFRKSEEERLKDLRKQIEGVLKVSIEWVQKQHEEYLMTRSVEVKQGLGLAEERQKKLDDAARTTSEKAAKDWEGKLERLLLMMPEQNRRQIIKQGRYYVGLDEDALKKANSLWDKHVQEILTPDEINRLATAKAEDKASRMRALSLVLISMMDEQVAFTREQRERLRSLSETLVSKEEMLFPQPSAQYFNISTAAFFTTAGRATDEQLSPILTPQQIARWREASETKKRGVNSVVVNRGAVAPGKKDEPAPVITPEEVEYTISDFFIVRETEERKRLAADAALKAEDVARVISLAPEAIARLQIAAQGSTEVALAAWRDNAEQNIRSQLTNLNPQQIRQRLDGMESYQFYSGRSSQGVPIWENTVKQVLTPEQQTVWKSEVDQRAAFRREAAAAAIMAEFDRKYSATAEQTTKLEAFLTKFLEQYAPDIEGMFSPNNSVPWYLQTYSMFLPFGSLDEKQILEYLSKEQWERLKGSNEFSNATNYWENIEQQHKQRVKAKG